ncbi:uridine diphosphate glucose pyrophosphatase NUDT22-like [Lineus longissimus]|uniref:uridine diphosphate glucose pyrophosphatase NUDT22-like n=1 Tax=Lineus longissimus TaxID=88925 RepID=UPI002B4CA187
MDPDIEIMIFTPHSKPISRNNTSVETSKEFNRILLTSDMEKVVQMYWQERIQANPRLFNGTKFRLHSVLHSKEAVTLNLGITCYKDYLGTNWGPNAKVLLKQGVELHNNSQSFMSDALGVGSLVVTADSYVILLRRSLDLAEASGLWDVPGGHAEPEMLVGKRAACDIEPESLNPSAVVDEIFDSVLREIRDEVNIPIEKLSDPSIMGIARNTQSAGRPSMEFMVRCNLTSSEIIQLYSKGDHKEADESTSIKMLSLGDVKTLQDATIWKELAPSAKGCIYLYQKVFS